MFNCSLYFIDFRGVILMERQVSERNLRKARDTIADHVTVSKYLSDMLQRNLDSQGKICCPVHDEGTPSFHYDDTRKTGHCFGCHVGGTIVELHMHIKRKENPHYSQIRAVKDLSRKYNVEIPDLFSHEIATEDRVKKSSRVRRSANTDTYFKEKLNYVTKASLQAPKETRLLISKTLDDIYMGRITVRDGYIACRESLLLGGVR